ncbi:terminase small subunit [Acinetobacter johnsonii]|uniref:terminase small subunit n=1 Tax=Acinetobacter johnsonii TaxID=40214 RepID=UPI003AF81745
MSAIIKGQEVTRQGLADIFGVSLPTIDNWVRQGCPYISKGGRGQEWKFNTASVSTWLRDRDVEEATGGIPDDFETLKCRKMLADAQLAELELAQKKGEVAHIEEFERMWSLAMGQLRQNILGVPQRAVLQLIGETDERKFKTKLRAEIVLALDQSVELDRPEEDE